MVTIIQNDPELSPATFGCSSCKNGYYKDQNHDTFFTSKELDSFLKKNEDYLSSEKRWYRGAPHTVQERP